MRKAVWGPGIVKLGVVLVLVALSACGDLTRQGQASSYLVVNEMLAAQGSDTSTFTANLLSDVVTVKDGVPSVFNDLGKVTFTLAMKDAGSAASPTTPTSANYITIDRYDVRYTRTDGRNAQGVDVPYAFTGAMTVTVADMASQSFELVRHTAKLEAPLAALASNGVIVNTIADITFYGHDQTGRSVSATAKIYIDFGNFADKK